MENRIPISALPLPVGRALRKLGADIRDARKRRRIPMALMAQRASISRVTLAKVEKGEATVSMGIYATVLFVLGMIGNVSELAGPTKDLVGISLDEERLPQRVRLPTRGKTRAAAITTAARNKKNVE